MRDFSLIALETILMVLYFTVRSDPGRNNSWCSLQTGIRWNCQPRNYLFASMWVLWLNTFKFPSKQYFPRYLSSKTSQRNIIDALLAILHKIGRHAPILLKIDGSQECLLELNCLSPQIYRDYWLNTIIYHVSYDIRSVLLCRDSIDELPMFW